MTRPIVEMLNGCGVVHVRLPALQTYSERPIGYGVSGEFDEELARYEETTAFAKGISHNFERDLLPDRSRNLALITCDGYQIQAVALMQKERATSSFQNRVRFHRIRPIPGIRLVEVLEDLLARHRRHAEKRVRQEMAKFPPKTGEAIVGVLSKRSTEFGEAVEVVLDGLRDRVWRYEGKNDPWRTIAEEKDAVDTALKLADFTPTTLADKDLSDAQPRPFLELLGTSSLEDDHIALDLDAFGGLDLIRRDARGIRVFRDPHGQATVTVANANRKAIERTLGVDLVIHFSRFQSYLLVQYKRLVARGKDGTPIYRPGSDANFQLEVERMLALRPTIVEAQAESPDQYRLNWDPFYFKFCSAHQFDPDKLGMMPGLYFPATDILHFLDTDHAKGPQDGVRISRDQLGRRFSNTMFVQLAQHGWIGSRSVGTTIIEEYIRRAVEGDRSVVLANVRTS